MGHFFRVFIVIAIFGACLYLYINKLNAIAEIKLQIPEIMKEMQTIDEENTRLSYAKESFEDPVHLLALLNEPEYSHLKFPLLEEIKSIPESLALNQPPLQSEVEKEVSLAKDFYLPLTLGAKK